MKSRYLILNEKETKWVLASGDSHYYICWEFLPDGGLIKRTLGGGVSKIPRDWVRHRDSGLDVDINSFEYKYELLKHRTIEVTEEEYIKYKTMLELIR